MAVMIRWMMRVVWVKWIVVEMMMRVVGMVVVAVMMMMMMVVTATVTIPMMMPGHTIDALLLSLAGLAPGGHVAQAKTSSTLFVRLIHSVQ